MDRQQCHRGKFNSLSLDLHRLRRMWYITWRCDPRGVSESLIWLNVFCACASTLFMKEVICRSFSYIVLVSLSMAQAISTSCSSTDVMPVAITNMVIKNKEVKKLEWSKGLFYFNSPIGEQVVELASTIEYRDLSSKSFIVEWYFSLPWKLYPFGPKEAKVMTSWWLSHVSVVFNKQVCSLANFVSGAVVNFALLHVIRLIKLLYVDWVMTILASPLSTCVTSAFLNVIVLVVITFLEKEMRGKEVPTIVLEIYMHKFHESSIM